jgi:hypothetical protein
MSIGQITRANVRAQLPLVKQRLRIIELQIAPLEARKLAVEFDDSPVFPVGGRSEGYYQATRIDELLAHLDKLGLPAERNFVDCGSGLGHACYAAAAVFDQVTGFERDPEIFRLAQGVLQGFGFTNISLHRWDFIDVSLAPFNVVYFYKPFASNFGEVMREKLLETETGTVIIAAKYLEKELLDRANFEFSGPLARWQPSPETPFMPLEQFYTFVRK